MAFAALSSGVSGLTAFTEGIGIISDNIVNVNTVGYKETRSRFTTLVTETQSTTRFSPGGVAARAQTLISEQGLLRSTASQTDLGVDGAGFFVVRAAPSANSPDGEIQFTRAGNFTPDSAGFLKNTAGNFLLGFPIDSQGNIPTNIGDLSTLEPINVSGLTGTAEATSNVSLRANLQSSLTATTTGGSGVGGVVAQGDLADGTIPPDFAQTITVFDSQGSSQGLTLAAVKTGTNTFRFEIFAQDPTAINVAETPPGLVMSGEINFNSDGSLTSFNQEFPNAVLINPANGQQISPTANLNFAGGASTETVTFNFGRAGDNDGITQFDSTSTLISSNVNGAVFGNVIGTNISEDGVVTALFDNGLSRDVFQLPVATFPNPDGLTRLQGNAFGVSDNSGNFSVVLPGTGGAGTIAPSTLEASTVDLAEEFADLIVTQRSFSASTRIISAADEVLEELVRI
ncbi:flagellar hook protein FlgE [Iodidimonas muriae]|uniref:Flagellar hook protein FlgE n=1 Tax=Iodidimonas muriae TaxID=261467 RepID=A0ABQ2LH45_9PROT|nr:flagellar hook-basal body complex protein [Iodidimonas muriae]GER07801.1 flagellar hook protein FlgE [Kordiimonadales bacterium JCM 17843]GGO15185.1 flagellar hook protein FlgE [Iodidimonas muriae]